MPFLCIFKPFRIVSLLDISDKTWLPSTFFLIPVTLVQFSRSEATSKLCGNHCMLLKGRECSCLKYENEKTISVITGLS